MEDGALETESATAYFPPLDMLLKNVHIIKREKIDKA